MILASFQSFRQVTFPIRSPKPATVMRYGAFFRMSVSPMMSSVQWAGMVFLSPPTFMMPTLAAKPSIGAPVAIVKQGSPRRKLEYRVISVMEPVPTPIMRSASPGTLTTISPSVASSKPVCCST